MASVNEEPKSLREIVGRFIEDMGADAVVVLWTETTKDGSKSKIVSWGNQFAVRDCIQTAANEYSLERINLLNDRFKRPPNKNEGR